MGAGSSLTGLTPPFFCACPKPEPEFFYVIIMFNNVRCEVVVHLDIFLILVFKFLFSHHFTKL